MRRLIVAGLLYLTGIAVILLIKPQYMFQRDGHWKEFGIGRDPEKFTNVPFWLFAIVWAILSYVLVSIMDDAFYGHLQSQTREYEPAPAPVPVMTPNRNNRNSRNARVNSQQELVPGYYMLNEGATGRNGVPRYVYLGPEEPEL